MFYFSFFPDVVKNNVLVKDITKRYDLLDKIMFDDKYFIEIELVEGESIDSVANRIYGNTEYSWLILICNRGVHPLFCNYKSEQEMTDYIKRKYSVEMFDAHHFEDLSGKILDEVDSYYYSLDNFNLKYKDVVKISHDKLEREKNNKQRILRIIKPEYLTQIIDEIVSLSK